MPRTRPTLEPIGSRTNWTWPNFVLSDLPTTTRFTWRSFPILHWSKTLHTVSARSAWSSCPDLPCLLSSLGNWFVQTQSLGSPLDRRRGIHGSVWIRIQWMKRERDPRDQDTKDPLEAKKGDPGDSKNNFLVLYWNWIKLTNYNQIYGVFCLVLKHLLLHKCVSGLVFR